MRQIRLVFWKDVRQLWWQVSVYAALLAAYAWAVPQTWPGSAPNSFLAAFVTLLKLLIMAAQFVLITSAVHADRLVGEEQFWITRPYDWRSLLGAKFLFVLACVVVPYVLMQWWLLHVAGLSPFAAKAGMASSLLRFVFPCVALMLIAAVTETLAAAFMFLAAVLLVFVGFLQFILAGTETRMQPPFEFAVFGPVFGILLLAILSYQFARRRTVHSRIAIAAMLALFLLYHAGYETQGFGAPVREVIRSHYEVPSDGSLRMVFAPGPVPYEERGQDLEYLRHHVEVKLPIRLEGLPADARIRETNVAVTLTAKGVRYASPWQNATVSEDAIGFPIPKELFARIAGEEIGLHLELIGEEMRPVGVERVAAADRFRGPSGANCILVDGKVVCRYAYEELVPTHVEASTHAAACDGQGAATPAGTWLLQMPSGGRVDPVVNEKVALQGRVCAGDLVTFREYGSPRRFRLVLDVPGVKLEDYQARDSRG